MAASPPTSLTPLIPTTYADPPTQRVYLLAVLLLLQAFKISDFILSTPIPLITAGALDEGQVVNWKLVKWLVLDGAGLFVVQRLRVPRMSIGGMGVLLLSAAMGVVDYGFFGGWKFSTSILIPNFLKLLVSTYTTTEEKHVRLSKVIASNSHLLGAVTVHLLALSTAQLNPTSAISKRCFCLPGRSTSPVEPILIPLLFNNTLPSRLSYNLTSFDFPPVTTTHFLSAKDLKRPKSKVLKAKGEGSVAKATGGGLEGFLGLPPYRDTSSPPSPASHLSQSQQLLHHQLPSTKSPSENNPYDLSFSEAIYYLPIAKPGIVILNSVFDQDNNPVRIKRVLASKADSSGKWEGTKILECPQAGFIIPSDKDKVREANRCLDPLEPESVELGLRVRGAGPLHVKWHEIIGSGKSAVKAHKELKDVSGSLGSEVGSNSHEIITIPINHTLSQNGRHAFFLDSISDICGNSISFDTASASSSKQKEARLLDGMTSMREWFVHPPPQVRFSGECEKRGRVVLLAGIDRKAILNLRMSGSDEVKSVEAGIVRIRGKLENGKNFEREVRITRTEESVEVDTAGGYEIVSIQNKWCEGAVFSPSICTVTTPPQPALSVKFDPLLDACSSEIGSLSTLHMNGTPPFTVHYTITSLSPNPQSIRKLQTFQQSHGEIRIESLPGQWEYRFTGIQDANYRQIVTLPSGLMKKLEVKPIGDAKWKDNNRKRVVHSCEEGEIVKVELELQGVAPWEVEYTIAGSSPQVLRGIQNRNPPITIPIPESIAHAGGQFALSLESVKDGNGCKRSLSAARDLEVEVRRTRPTARFGGMGGARSIAIRDYDSAKIPLRLMGEAPWTITYRSPPPSSKPSFSAPPTIYTTSHPNDEIHLAHPVAGTYTLLSVRDSHCPGDVLEREADWSFTFLPRPTLRLGDDLGQMVKNGSVLRKAVCAGVPDKISITMQGKAPFMITYTLTKGSQHSTAISKSHQSIRSTTDIDLFTAESGHHIYQIKGVSDSLYTSPSTSGLTASPGGRAGILRIEQEIFPIPSASFRHGLKSNRGFCLHETLGSRGSDDLILKLEGTPPFSIEVEVRDAVRHSLAKKFTIPDITTHEWPVTLPYTFESPSLHSISILHISDAHHCERTFEHGSSSTTLSLPVSEIASISPVSPQTEHCVGELLDFTLLGSPPFIVTYAFDSVRHVIPIPSSNTFSRLADTPGLFEIVSVGRGLEEQQCRSKQLVGMKKRIYEIPTARVSDGEAIVVNLREGDQTEIVFTFTGSPPFAFTYERRAPSDKGKAKSKKVLESQTITGVMEHSYSIFTSQEGTWTVSSISDAHCSYPPLSRPDSQKLLKNQGAILGRISSNSAFIS